MPLLWHKARGHYTRRLPDHPVIRAECVTCNRWYMRADDGVRTIAVVTLVLLMAVAGWWLALELARKPLEDVTPAPSTIQPTTQPGPPVTDWRPPQHRWETPPR